MLYFLAGKLLAYFTVHRRPKPRFFSHTLFSLLAATDPLEVKPQIDDIADYERKRQIEAVIKEQSAFKINDFTNV